MSETQPVVPQLNHLIRLSVQVEPPKLVGEGPLGDRKFIAIVGGEFEGEKLRGKILPGGGDWIVERQDKIAQLDARYVLETDDGALIYVQDQGLRHGPADTMARLAQGEPVDPHDYYFRTHARLETGDSRYAWLNQRVFVGSGMRRADRVLIDFYEIE